MNKGNWSESDEQRQEVIDQNGNTGEHYDIPPPEYDPRDVAFRHGKIGQNENTCEHHEARVESLGCFEEVSRVIGKGLAKKELQRVANKCPSMNESGDLHDSFSWVRSPQGFEFWQEIARGLNPYANLESATEASDGSTASYYELPPEATELQHLISYRNMNAQDGEIFRAIYRKGRASHSDALRDAKKVLFYAQAEVERLEKYTNG